MMLKKFGMLSVGVTAALLAAAPLASAGQCDDGHQNGGWDHGHGSQAVGNTNCTAKSGAVAGNNSDGSLLGIGPILDGNAGQMLSCNSMLNDVASHDNINILNGGSV